ncbi:hypothetical protein BDF19DRAFT_435338 [Syncephalis fuscata]|nr:hypothetical protein BDF19DRAFT_435338 [Syncephalis fuscata]
MTDTTLTGEVAAIHPLDAGLESSDPFGSSGSMEPYIAHITSTPPQNVYCCSLDRAIHAPGIVMVITAANKTIDAGGSTFIAYCIRFGNLEVRRRYSEFASLRKILGRMYPTAVIPPIPEKHSLTDYATKQSRAKEDMRIIEKRKRMLGSFLNRLVTHPILSTEHTLHQFLNVDEDWSSVLKSELVTSLPKRPIQRPPRPAAEDKASERDYNIPVPRGVAKLKNPNPLFEDLEVKTNNFAKHLQLHIDPDQYKVSRKLLGALYNGFSLTETDNLAMAIEKATNMENEVGERLHEYVQFATAIKALEKARVQLITLLPIAQQEAMAAQAAQQKRQQEQEEEERRQATSNVDENIAASEELSSGEGEDDNEEERGDSDDEAKMSSNDASRFNSLNPIDKDRVNSELNSIFGVQGTEDTSKVDGLVAEESWSVPASRAPTFNAAFANSFPDTSYGGGHRQVDLLRPPVLDEIDESGTATNVSGRPPYSHPGRLSHPTASLPVDGSASITPVAAGGSGGSIFSFISDTFHGLLDVDPEATRRNNIGRTQQLIAMLEEYVEVAENELVRTSTDIQQELDRCQQQKLRDFRDIMLAYARMQSKWCRKNLSAWEDARQEIDQIPAPMP